MAKGKPQRPTKPVEPEAEITEVEPEIEIEEAPVDAIEFEVVPKDTVKMIFSRPMFYRDPEVPLYEPNIQYDVPLKMRDRWIKRGGQLV